MLLNPYTSRLPTLGGTRLLQTSLGVVGSQLCDPTAPERVWTVQSIYAPIPGRHLGGVRAKLYDQKGFITFCNQRDLEVFLGVAAPGDWCLWASQKYVEPGDREWFGLCADQDDLLDDLYDRELWYRQQYTQLLPTPLEITRRIHLESGVDYEELFILRWDMDPDTGYGPDTRLETISRRWAKVERTSVQWRYISYE